MTVFPGTTWISLRVCLSNIDSCLRVDNPFIVRTTRVRIIRLRNDYKALMSRIETGLHEHFAKSKEHEIPLEPSQPTPATRGSDRDMGAASRQADEEAGAAFAKVNSVVTGSPADQAGLKAGDEVRLFGDVNWLNHEKLARVSRTL